MGAIWKWIKDDKNRDILKLSGAGLAAIVAAVWAVLTFAVGDHAAPSASAGPGGIAAGHDISGNTITTTVGPAAGNPAPKP
jgi:hypothetical protein